MSNGDEVVDGGQLALGQSFQRRQRRLDPALGAHDVADHLVALLGGQLQGGQHLQVGAHGGQRGAQFVGGDGGEVAGGFERRLGALLLVADAGQHALDRFGDLDGLTHTADLNLVGAGLGVDRAGLLGQQPERIRS